MSEIQSEAAARPGGFVRSMTGTAGSIVLLNGRIVKGWVRIDGATDDHVFVMLAETGDGPGDDLGRQQTEYRVAVVRVAAIAAWEYAGEDGW